MPGSRVTAARVVVVGASGFVGRAITAALRRHGAEVVAVTAPRLPPVPPRALTSALRDAAEVREALARRFRDADVVVNAAGISQAGSDALEQLLAANGLLPGVVAAAARAAAVGRVVQVSSGAVQGDADVLDSSPRMRPFSPYSYSKAVGEQAALGQHAGAVVYRPAGVQGVQRSVSRNLVRVSRSRLALVGGAGTGNSPQALVDNVADAIAFLALFPGPVPPIVHHPSEGVTVRDLLHLLSGKPPRRIPSWVARAVVRALTVAGRVLPAPTARRRRLEVMWFGQEQAPSWLTAAGWRPIVGREGWVELGRALA